MDYPEHEKMKAIAEESQKQGDFLQWLMDHGYALCERRKSEVTPYWPTYKTISTLLALYHKIDLKKIEQEKRAMLEEIRKSNKK